MEWPPRPALAERDDARGWRALVTSGVFAAGAIWAKTPSYRLGDRSVARDLLVILSGCLASGLLLGSALLVSVRLQRYLMYLHWVPLPIVTYWLPFQEWQFTDLRNLSAFRLRHIARTIRISTSDGEVLQGWHVAPSQLGPDLASSSLQAPGKDVLSEDLREAAFDEALADASRPAVLFLHGQGGTRGVYNRVEVVRGIASQLQAHVIAIDYRGFGGSSGSPAQEGLVLDAIAAWSWIRARRRTGIFVYGQSLGAAVALQLAARLESPQAPADAGTPSGVVLDAPFSSAPAAALRHPLYRPLAKVPVLRDALARALADRWESVTVVKRVFCPLLVFGSGRDGVVGPDGAVELARTAAKERGETGTVQLAIVEDALHTNAYASDKWLICMARFLARTSGEQRS